MKKKTKRQSKNKGINKFQDLYYDAISLIGGLIFSGTIFGVLKSTYEFLPRIETLTFLIFVLILIYTLLWIFIKKIGIPWKIGKHNVKFKSIPRKISLTYLGIVLLLLGTLFFRIINTTTEFVCDRDADLGCTLDFKPNEMMSNVTMVKKSTKGRDVALKYITIYSGDNNEQNYISSIDTSNLKIFFPNLNRDKHSDIPNEKNNFTQFHIFPEEKKMKLEAGPFSLIVKDNRVNFKGILHDLKTHEILGKFSGNEFTIREPCGFSWNKDDKAVEIIDRYGYVCFSMEIVEENVNSIAFSKGLKFRGYFQKNDFYYIYNKDIFKTKDIIEAEKLISKISPIFEHYNKNALGKRLF